MRKLAVAVSLFALFVFDSAHFDGKNTVVCGLNSRDISCVIIGVDENGKTGFSNDYECSHIVIDFVHETRKCLVPAPTEQQIPN